MAQLPIRPITNKTRLMGAVALFMPEGTSKYIKVGACESIEVTPNITQVPVYTSEFGDKRQIANVTTEKTGTVSINGASQWTEFLYQVQAMANPKYRTQAAATGKTFEIKKVAVGDVIELPGIRATNVEITDSASSVYVEDEHYTYHAKTGLIEIIKLPEGAATDATGTYDEPAVTEADKLLDLAFMETSGVRGKLRVVGVISTGYGKETEMILNDVEFTPSGAISIGDVNNPNVATITGSMYSTSAAGYGTLRALETL